MRVTETVTKSESGQLVGYSLGKLFGGLFRNEILKEFKEGWTPKNPEPPIQNFF